MIKQMRELEEKINWTNAWGKKYTLFSLNIRQMWMSQAMPTKSVQCWATENWNVQFNEQDAMLVLKDILYSVWKDRKNRAN